MERTQQHIILLLALLVFYAVGPLVVMIWGLVEVRSVAVGTLQDGLLVEGLAAFTTNPTAYTGVLHQMILPVAAAVTAANARSLLEHNWSRWLFILPLATILVCIFDALFINITLSTEDAKAALNGATPNAIAQVFLGSAGTLATYVMLLVGLQAAAPGAAEKAADVDEEKEVDEERGSIAWNDAQEKTDDTNAPGVG